METILKLHAFAMHNMHNKIHNIMQNWTKSANEYFRKHVEFCMMFDATNSFTLQIR